MVSPHFLALSDKIFLDLDTTQVFKELLVEVPELLVISVIFY